jgi:hypothetical protein
MELHGYFLLLVSLLSVLCDAIPTGTSATSLKTSVASAASAASASSAASKSDSAATSATASAAKPAGAAASGSISKIQIANAVSSWMNDTAKVTKFLNTATSLTGDDYTKQATIALNAEKDELNHKKILDTAMGQMAYVIAANNVLETQGSFQNVVDILQKMVNEGPDMAQANVNAINQNRCINV